MTAEPTVVAIVATGDTISASKLQMPLRNGAHAPLLEMNGTGAGHSPERTDRPADPRSAPNDPLAGMTPWQIFQRCVWVSDEDANTKISLLCVSRFMDKDLRASSMSYAQIARDCGFSEPTAKRCAKAVANTWLRIGIGKGRYVPGKGHENLYDGIIPQRWADEVRRRMLGGIAVKPDEAIQRAADKVMAGRSGVSDRYPEGGGVSHGHPETPISGYQPDTGVSQRSERGITQIHLLQKNPPEEEKREGGADAPVDGAGLPLEEFGREGAPPTKGRRKANHGTQAAREAFDLYVAVAERCSLSKPRATPKLLEKIAARLREFDGLDGWKEVLAKVEATRGLQGENDRGWRVDIHWLTDNSENFNKVLSGKYDNWSRSQRGPSSGGGVF